MSNLSFSIMENNQIDKASKLVAEAFYDYEYMTTYISDDIKRKKFLSVAIPIEVKINDQAIRFIAKQDDDIVAVAMLFSPTGKRKNDITYIRAGMLKAFLYGGVLNVNSWVNMDKKASTPCHNLKGNVWYLNLLTVEKSLQSRGIGSKFINECIVQYVKNNGGDKLSLFTNSEKNREFYLKNGFREFDYREFYYKGRELKSFSMIKEIY